MARKKAKKYVELDEESVKKIYIEKNFTRPTEKELETINEEDNESSADVSQDDVTVTGNMVFHCYGNNYENIGSIKLKVSIKSEAQQA